MKIVRIACDRCGDDIADGKATRAHFTEGRKNRKSFDLCIPCFEATIADVTDARKNEILSVVNFSTSSKNGKARKKAAAAQ